MIISASRRTDIPTYYSEWFFNRIKEKYVLVRNPMNAHQVSRIDLSPEVVDGIVFWTKNPIPMMDELGCLKEYIYYFQFTLNAYGKDIEPNIPSKRDVLIPAFRKLSKEIGKERVVWRYDPIFLNEKYTPEYHVQYFKNLASKLCDYTEKCTISFIDLYRNTERNAKKLALLPFSFEQKMGLMRNFSEIAAEYGLSVDTCAEEIEAESIGIKHAHCVDKERFERLTGCTLNISKDKNQRPACGCVESIDIGAYNTCKNGCLYCYANYNAGTVEKNFNCHSPESPLISGELCEKDKVHIREVKRRQVCRI